MSARDPDRLDHGLVLGGGFAGLVTARVLADHFEKVTLLDRDELPDAPDHRKGTPQGPHTHILPASGLSILLELFPDLEDDLDEARAPAFDWTRDFIVYADGFAPRPESGLRSRLCTRKLLEWAIRRRVRAISNVELVPEHRVRSLITDDAGARVVGVATSSAEERQGRVSASFVIDATGRTSRTPRWLAALGFPEPAVDVVDIQAGSATQTFTPPTDDGGEWAALMTRPTPENPRQAALTRIEHGIWRVSVDGISPLHPPKSAEGFMDFLRALPYAGLYEHVGRANALSKVVSYRNNANRWFHYEAMPRFPDRYAVVGDAFFHANPMYAQGMALACQAGVTVRDELVRGLSESSSPLDGLGRRIHESLARAYRRLWLWNICAELTWLPSSSLHRERPFDLVRPYLQSLRRRTREEPELQILALKITHGVLPLEAAFAPEVVDRIAQVEPDLVGPQIRELAEAAALDRLTAELSQGPGRFESP